MNTWFSVNDKLPPVDETDKFYPIHSEKVLFTDGKDKYAGYFQKWEDDAFPSQWILEGRDGYTMENITHWTYFPDFTCN